MKRMSISLPIIAAASLFTLFIAFSSTGVYATDRHVPSDFATIQDALASSTAGDSIVVAPGTYPGGITLSKNVTIKGTETARTFLTGNGGGPVLTVNGAQIGAIGTLKIQNFTFVNATSGISLLNNTNNSVNVNITNNVFQGLGTAITEQTSVSTTVANNTFYKNGTALVCDLDIGISNNIFSGNGIAINDAWVNPTKITNNDFFNENLSSSTTGTTNPMVIDPCFVDPLNHDFHLTEEIPGGNPCLVTADNISAPPDIGAYGGQAADTIPFPVSGLTITSTTDTSIGLTWLPNNSYLVTNSTTSLVGGYNLYVGSASGVYTGALTSSGTISSPIKVGPSTSYTLTGLTPPTTPAAPDKVLSSPRDSALALTWSAVPGATGYQVFYGISSPTENGPFDTLGPTTSYELLGLTNGQHYLIAVKAYTRQQYFFNVTAYDNQFKDSASTPLHESAYLATHETSTQIGQPLYSGLTTTTDFPEALTTYPALPNTGGRCFIATAAYGYYSAPEVQALRAFRDQYLLAFAPGRMFVEWYYRHGPAAAAFLNDHPGYKPMVRAALMPAVGAAIFMTRTSMLFKIIMFLTIGAVIAFGFHRKRLSGTGGLR